MPEKRHKLFAADAAIQTQTYRGPDRRDEKPNLEADETSREVRFDSKEYPILDVFPRKRLDDRTIGLIQCLDADKLNIEVDDN